MLTSRLWPCALLLLIAAALSPRTALAEEGDPPPPEGPPPGEQATPPPEGDISADLSGVMVAVTVAEGQPEPTAAVLTNVESGTETRIPINDGGTDGDVTAGDRTWAGSMWLDGDSFEVSLLTDEGPLEVGPVSWEADERVRDLLVTVDASQVSAQALTAAPVDEPTPPPEGTEGEPPPPGDTTPPPPGDEEPPTAVEGQPPPPKQPGSGSALGAGATAADEGGGNLLRIAGLALGLLALVGVVWWWRQSSSGSGSTVGAALPEPSLLGGCTPSISDRVSVWTVASADSQPLFAALLGAVARGRAVVVSAPASMPIPPVHGGPVHKPAYNDADGLGDALDGFLRSGVRAAGFMVCEKPTVEQLAELESVRAEGAAIVVIAVDGAGIEGSVACSREGAAWVIQSGESSTTLRVGPTGLEHADVS